jgi:hypothetical protein
MVAAIVEGRAEASEPMEESGTDLQFGDLVVEVTRHVPFAKQLEAKHLDLYKAVPVVATLGFSGFPC